MKWTRRMAARRGGMAGGNIRQARFEMIVVTGTIVARPGMAAEVLALSLEHVRRSRAEPGCLSHDVFVDPENPLRMFFFERWADEPALRAHFEVPASREFVRALKDLLAETTGTQIVRTEPIFR